MRGKAKCPRPDTPLACFCFYNLDCPIHQPTAHVAQMAVPPNLFPCAFAIPPTCAADRKFPSTRKLSRHKRRPVPGLGAQPLEATLLRRHQCEVNWSQCMSFVTSCVPSVGLEADSFTGSLTHRCWRPAERPFISGPCDGKEGILQVISLDPNPCRSRL